MGSVVPAKIIKMPHSPTIQPAVQLEARPLGIFLNCGYGIYEGSRPIAKIKFGNGFNSFLASFDILGISTLWDKGYRGWVVTPAARYRVRQKSKFIKTTTWLEQNKTSVVEARQRLIPPRDFFGAWQSGISPGNSQVRRLSNHSRWQAGGICKTCQGVF